MDGHRRKPWYSMPLGEVFEKLNVSDEGLSDIEAAERLKKYGKNELRRIKPKSIFKMLWEQLTDVMVLILIAAAVLSAFLDEWAEAVVILVIVAINALISIIQEKKASNALEALRSMSAPSARALRQGEESIVPAADLVPGDIVYLEDGCI
ncbi:MAG: cation-transporting P-type ATPase, partial [Alphaproteobacteria bacterium]